MKTILRMLWALPLLLLAAAAVAPVEAFTLQPGGNAPYLCATTTNATTGNGTPVVLQDCSGYPNQQWNWVNGQIQGPTVNGTECLDNLFGSDANRFQPVYMNPCSGSESQQWSLGGSGPVIGLVLSVSQCLDSVGGPNVGGFTQLVVNTCLESPPSQNWTLERLELSLEEVYPYQCISLEGGGITNGTNAIVTSCNDSPSQRWALQNNKLMGLGTWNGNSMCLETAGSYVTLGNCTPQWNAGIAYLPVLPVIVDTTTYVFCLDASGPPAPGGGTYLVLNDCNLSGSATQNWALR